MRLEDQLHHIGGIRPIVSKEMDSQNSCEILEVPNE